MTNNPKLTPEQRRKQLYFKKWGLNEKNSTGDLHQDMRNWRHEADVEMAQEKKNKLSKATPTKPASDGITKSRLFYEKIMGDFDHD